MARRTVRKSVDRSRYEEYQRVADHFYEAAKDSIDLEYWTAAAVLIVHSAIAFADALAIQQSGQRSAGDDHDDTIALLDEVIADSEHKRSAMNQLRRIIEEKSRASYMGELYGPQKTRDLWNRLERFRRWARSILER